MKTIDKLSARALQKYSDELRHIAVLAYACDVIQDLAYIDGLSSTDSGVHITAGRDDKETISKALAGFGFDPGRDIADFTAYDLSGSILFVSWRDAESKAA
jgi:hypothetical protein